MGWEKKGATYDCSTISSGEFAAPLSRPAAGRMLIFSPNSFPAAGLILAVLAACKPEKLV